MVLSVEEACNLIGCKRAQLFRLLSQGLIERAPRHGRALRIYRDSVERLLARPKVRRKRRPHATIATLDDLRPHDG